MDWFRRFMTGRYGVDQLYVALIVLSMFFLLLSSITGWPYFAVVSLLLFAYAYFRVLSRRIYKRSQENLVFLKLWVPVSRWFRQAVRRIKDLRRYKYFKCAGCGRSLRVPRGKGKVRVTCPVCRTAFVKKT